MNSYKFIIFGKVQGVWYRKYVMQIAKALGYVGYVKNLKDGSVEVVVNLDLQSELESFISKLYEGSTFSKVTDIECQKIDFVDFENFEKRV
ncbi:acylphosphatase [Sulfurospirillum arcachonense]|uniref:acylphosphatase n=1 Tax=Sulfurospirillum arcachonense TaxID=57666 RepID=UPI0004694E33|nr:acylphosphatase [Sulfurospirillum arcachonense]